MFAEKMVYAHKKCEKDIDIPLTLMYDKRTKGTFSVCQIS